MANEITLNAQLAFATTGVSTAVQQPAVAVTPSTVASVSETSRSIGTDDETLTTGDLTAPGWLLIKNLDATNFVLLGSDGTNWPIKIPAAKSAGPIFWNAAAVHVKADTNACLIAYVLTDR